MIVVGLFLIFLKQMRIALMSNLLINMGIKIVGSSSVTNCNFLPVAPVAYFTQLPRIFLRQNLPQCLSA
ncbi:hypothetical protein ECANGB1_2669 [Enterospora canceri]|uniref:Uncharacterized protein n=1 Tax=Enterospora canceri TaxID=1081671 RepID=A0A1Y1S550_9MICR|nr:hypothetical protein ECANGB1_2669 [Enterospora canceri]